MREKPFDEIPFRPAGLHDYGLTLLGVAALAIVAVVPAVETDVQAGASATLWPIVLGSITLALLIGFAAVLSHQCCYMDATKHQTLTKAQRALFQRHLDQNSCLRTLYQRYCDTLG